MRLLDDRRRVAAVLVQALSPFPSVAQAQASFREKPLAALLEGPGAAEGSPVAGAVAASKDEAVAMVAIAGYSWVPLKEKR